MTRAILGFCLLLAGTVYLLQPSEAFNEARATQTVMGDQQWLVIATE